MRFGLFGGARTDPGEQASDSRIYSDYIDYICEAEELGFHSVFLVEHHFTGFGQVSATLNFLTYLAAKTTKMRLGTAVLVLPWHNPALLAEQAATLDLLSNGRLDFGVGKGYRAYEFSGFCIPPEEATERFDEAMAVIRKAWASPGRFSHQGKWWHFDNVVVEPSPIQQPVFRPVREDEQGLRIRGSRIRGIAIGKLPFFLHQDFLQQRNGFRVMQPQRRSLLA